MDRIVMDWINYGLDSVWITKNVNRIAYGLNMDMNNEYGSDALSKLDQNLAEDIGIPNKKQWVLIILKQRVTTWTISNRHQQNF